MRVRLSNAFGDRPLTFDSVYAGLQQEGAALVPGSNRRVTFDGRTSVTIRPAASSSATRSRPGPRPHQPGRQPAQPRRRRPATGHRLAMQTSYLTQGDHTADESAVPWTRTVTSWFYLDAVTVRTRPYRRGRGARRLHHRRLGVHHGPQPPLARPPLPPPPALPRHHRPGRGQRGHLRQQGARGHRLAQRPEPPRPRRAVPPGRPHGPAVRGRQRPQGAHRRHGPGPDRRLPAAHRPRPRGRALRGRRHDRAVQGLVRVGPGGRGGPSGGQRVHPLRRAVRRRGRLRPGRAQPRRPRVRPARVRQRRPPPLHRRGHAGDGRRGPPEGPGVRRGPRR